MRHARSLVEQAHSNGLVPFSCLLSVVAFRVVNFHSIASVTRRPVHLKQRQLSSVLIFILEAS